jgi:NADH dehydrogenase
MRVLVLGGTGFLGRHVVAALDTRGHEVVVGSRDPGPRFNAPGAPERCVVRFEDLTAPERWEAVLAGADAVVNCVGILRERGRATYERVHLVAPAALAVACGTLRIRRLVHVSALGLRPDARSRFIVSKLRGEVALKLSGVPSTIVRPSLLEGPDGYGARWLRRIAAWPVHVVPADAKGRIAIVDVRDVASAIAVLCDRPPPRRVECVEFGGRTSFAIHEYLAMLRQSSGKRPARLVRVSPETARLASHLCDALHVSPFSYAHLELLRRDNVPSINGLPRLLQRALHGIASPLDTPSGWDRAREAAWSDATLPH